MVEPFAHNGLVVGSNPARSTNFFFICIKVIFIQAQEYSKLPIQSQYNTNFTYDFYESFMAYHNKFCNLFNEQRKDNKTAITYHWPVKMTRVRVNDLYKCMCDWFEQDYKAFSNDQHIFFYTESMLISFRRWRGEAGEDPDDDIDLYISIVDDQDRFEKFKQYFTERFTSNIIPEIDGKIAKLLYIDTDGHLCDTEARVKQTRKFNPDIYAKNIGSNPSKFIDDYINSNEPILILTGKPGMGKSSLICEIIRRMDSSVYVTYDRGVMDRDDTYIKALYRYERSLLVLEDAEIVMRSREEGVNPAMARILNMSDGIISNDNIKIILTANIDNLDNIDSALTRPGRCFAVVKFDELNYEEANKLADSLGKKLVGNKKSYTIAEIYNSKQNFEENKTNRIGFY